MKNYCIILFCLGIVAALQAQTAVTSGAGTTASINGYTLDFSIGEMSCIETVEAAGQTPIRQVTQGFLQPQTAMAVVDRSQTPPAFQVSVFPNPATDVLYLQGNWPAAQHARCAILRPDGAVLHEQETGSGSATFAIDQLSPGVYLLRVQAGGESVVQRFVKVR